MSHVNEPHATQPVTARSIINARRRRNAFVQVCLLPCFAVFFWWLASHHYQGNAFYLSIFPYLIISATVARRELCPRCKRNVSMLPSEGHLRLPELSHSVRMCPFCGADFSITQSEASTLNKVNNETDHL